MLRANAKNFYENEDYEMASSLLQKAHNLDPNNKELNALYEKYVNDFVNSELEKGKTLDSEAEKAIANTEKILDDKKTKGAK